MNTRNKRAGRHKEKSRRNAASRQRRKNNAREKKRGTFFGDINIYPLKKTDSNIVMHEREESSKLKMWFFRNLVNVEYYLEHI